MNQDTILIIFVGITTVSFVTLAVCALALLMAVKKGFESARGEFNQFRDVAMPMLATTKDLVESSKDVFESSRTILRQLAPNIGPISTDAAATMHNVKAISDQISQASGKLNEMVEKVREQADTVENSAAEILVQVKQQADRFDGMITNVLDAVDHSVQVLQTTVAVPARQFAGFLAAAKAIFNSLRSYQPPAARVRTVNNDHESFI